MLDKQIAIRVPRPWYGPLKAHADQVVKDAAPRVGPRGRFAHWVRDVIRQAAAREGLELAGPEGGNDDP